MTRPENRGSISGKEEIFLFSTASIQALGINHSPVLWIPWAPMGLKLPEYEAVHSFASIVAPPLFAFS
jgi:hypothetical protein